MRDLVEQRQAISDLMEFAVPEGDMDEANDLLDVYRHDQIALDLLHEFYSFLPEAKNDLVREIRLIRRRQGVVLLAAVTRENRYIYLVSSEGIEFQGDLAEGVYDINVLEFFEYADREEFCRESSKADNYPVYEPMDSDPNICPACYSTTGELHELGCPVEVCPWCGGQLVHCSCRFDKLDADELQGERDLLRFEEILNEQGRIPYSPEQRPSFADEGPGVIVD